MTQTAKKILITGGMGLIGSHIARLAHNQGHQVTVFDLPKTLDSSVPYSVASGSVCNLSQLQQAMRGQDWVIHCAGNPNLWARHNELMYQVNTQGTLNVIKALVPGQRLIHMSSDCTLMSRKNAVVHEQSITELSDMTGHYCKSKWLAEQAVLKASQRGLDALVVNPGVPVSSELQVAPFVQMIHSFLTRKISGYIPGKVSWIDADDLASCTLACASKGAKGQRYLGVYNCIDIYHLFKHLETLTGIHAPSWQVPLGLAHLGASFSELWGKLSGQVPLATRAGIQLALDTRAIDNKKTLEALNLTFKDPTPTLDRLVLSMHQAINKR